MQLKYRRQALTAATLTLLGGTAAPSAQAGDRTWDIDSAVLVYSESDGRVQAVEPVFKGTLDLDGERYFTTKLVFDALTGATPNGATPASTPQTFSGASGGGQGYTTPAYETPLDDRFEDTRVQSLLDYVFPVGDDGTLGIGGTVSSEYDFLSAGGNLRYTHDLFQNNTSLSAGLSVEIDRIDPVGGAPDPLSRVATGGAGGGDDEGEGEEGEGGAGTESKTVTDFVLGWTQVLGPRSLVQFNYALSASSGYQNDPYKLLSVVGSDGEPDYYVWESRPDSRLKHALFARYKLFAFSRDVIDTSYRYMTDDWGIASSTVDLSYRWHFGAQHYLEPHLRWYTQTAADFYHVALYTGGDQTIDYASADPRLGALDAWTAGLKLGGDLSSGSAWSARLEWYQQQSKLSGVPVQAEQGLSKFDLQPDLSAVMLTAGYRFQW